MREGGHRATEPRPDEPDVRYRRYSFVKKIGGIGGGGHIVLKGSLTRSHLTVPTPGPVVAQDIETFSG
jgi:hypothetical protein